VPPGRIQALARFATTARASAIQRLPDERRLATLVAFALTLEATALDDVLDLLDILITEIFANATKAGEKARLRSIKDLDAAASQLSQACRLVLDPLIPDEALRAAIFKAVERDALESALGQVEALVRPPEDTYYQELKQSWRRVRLFLPALLTTVRFGYTPAGTSLANALKQLAKQDGRVPLVQVRPETVPRAWRQYVFGRNDVVDRRAYTFCCLDRVRSALRRRDLFVTPSRGGGSSLTKIYAKSPRTPAASATFGTKTTILAFCGRFLREIFACNHIAAPRGSSMGRVSRNKPGV